MQGAALVLTTYINFGALSMNYVNVLKDLALSKDDYRAADHYDGQIAALSVIMELLTFSLFVSFGAATIKKVFYKTKTMVQRKRTGTGGTAASSSGAVDDALQIQLTTAVASTPLATYPSFPHSFATTNPMHMPDKKKDNGGGEHVAPTAESKC